MTRYRELSSRTRRSLKSQAHAIREMCYDTKADVHYNLARNNFMQGRILSGVWNDIRSQYYTILAAHHEAGKKAYRMVN